MFARWEGGLGEKGDGIQKYKLVVTDSPGDADTA